MQVTNITPNGATIRTSKRIWEGDKIDISLFNPNGNRYECAAMIKSCKMVDNWEFISEIKFIEVSRSGQATINELVKSWTLGPF